MRRGAVFWAVRVITSCRQFRGDQQKTTQKQTSMIQLQRMHFFLFALLLFGFHLFHHCSAGIQVKKTYYIGAIFETSQKDSPDYNGFLYAMRVLEQERPSSRNFNFRSSIQFVDDLSNSFQIASAMCDLAIKEVIAIFGPIHASTVHTVQSLSEHHRIMYFTHSDPHHYSSQTLVMKKAVNIVKLRPAVIPAAVDFIHYEEWKRVLYLYDSAEALFRLRKLFELSNQGNKAISADARQLGSVYGDSENSHSTLKYINKESKKYTPKYLVLDLDMFSSRKKLFNQLQYVTLDRQDYHFLLLDGDHREVNQTLLLNGGVNFTIFTMLDYHKENVQKYLSKHWKDPERRRSYKTWMDDEAELKNSLPKEAALMRDGLFFLDHVVSQSEEFTRPNKPNPNVPCSPANNPPFTSSELRVIIRKAYLEDGLTGPLSFDEFGFRNRYRFDIRESRIKKGLSLIGNWTANVTDAAKEETRNLVIQRPSSLTSRGPTQLANRTRIVSSIFVSPFLMKKYDADGNVIPGEYEGFCVDLIKEIADLKNFSYIIKPVNDSNFGAFVNQSWNGMIGELVRNEADLAVAPLTITSSRERVVDFSTPFMEVGLSVMFQKTKKASPKMFSFMEPLSKEIWMCIAFSYLGVSVVLFLVSRFSPYEWGVHPHGPLTVYENPQASNEFSIFNSFWFSLSAFMQQGGDISPRGISKERTSLSGRIVGGVWWFFTLIIVSSYTANLAAYLTVERMSNPIQSYEDLAKQTKIKYGVVNSGSSKEFFENSKMPIFRKMWQFMESNPDVFVASIPEGYQRVNNSNGDYAFLLESTINDWYNEREPCKTTKVGQNLDSGKGYGIATPPGSDLRDPINLAVLDLKERNVIPTLIKKWWEEKGECKEDKKGKADSVMNNSLEFVNVAGLFLLVSMGLGLGLTLSVLEFLYKCALYSKRTKRPIVQVMHEMWYNYAQLKLQDKMMMRGFEEIKLAKSNNNVEYTF